MSKKTTAVIKARRKVLPTASAPALAPARPVEPDEAETQSTRATDPHRTGADRTAVLRARVAAARQRHAHKRATGKLPVPPKPVAKTASKAAVKTKKRSAAAKPAAATETY